ncbi:type IV-A pilus assembly ATPase PilB [Moritella sp.]|uniref:type IV-A pilus assembly ATPase PilB n=1 Tax=Moritella sp. TaxID=78556 RepID=UPI001DB8CE7A|nr:type IV-A pilus assembly ATPase PilB [Moritella sp.]MCJ8349734.1 type IV-A pilus assembly ATPase PilB [Moritella sp.]NQZ39907.1 type IV-A pilus assembly ATPase PilB [Moritella sp.]
MPHQHNASGLAHSLVAHSYFAVEEIPQLLQSAKQEGKAFTTYIVDNNIIDSQVLAQLLEREYGVPLLDLDTFNLEEIPDNLLNEKLIDKHHALPIYVQGQTLYLAMSDPTNVTALEEFAFSFSLHTEVLLVDELQLQKALERVLESDIDALGDLNDADIGDLEVDNSESRLEQESKDSADDAPIVKFVNKILLDAIKKGASDIHFEPYEFKYRVRFRIDGILHEMVSPPVNLAMRFSARLKVMAKLDIAERRVPQDGRIKLKLSKNKSIDLRVSTLPTMWGEKVVMRILDSNQASLNIDILGYDEKQKALYLKALTKPQGMILVTGPTGSGKTVSLYSGLNILNTVERNISTAEDPIEINLSGINQVQINLKAGLTFPVALRSFLRQDPDVVMVGEIRDIETAEIAIKAAQTGHLVLSTLHTNSAAETLTRLSNMGVPAYNIGSSVSLIIAQRLGRRLCNACKQPEDIPVTELAKLGFALDQINQGITPFKAVGCNQCTKGYKGRVGIYEVMPMSDKISRMILTGSNSMELHDQAQQEGMDTLRQSALQKVIDGVTSLLEVERITSH